MGDQEDGEQFTEGWWKAFMKPLRNLRWRKQQLAEEQQKHGQCVMDDAYPVLRAVVKSCLRLPEMDGGEYDRLVKYVERLRGQNKVLHQFVTQCLVKLRHGEDLTRVRVPPSLAHGQAVNLGAAETFRRFLSLLTEPDRSKAKEQYQTQKSQAWLQEQIEQQERLSFDPHGYAAARRRPLDIYRRRPLKAAT